MPTKMTGKGLQRFTSRVWYVTDPDKPRPREHAAKGRGAALEKRKRKLGMYVKSYSYESRFCLLTILMDSQVSKSLKQLLNTVKPLSHRDSGKYTGNVLRHLFPDRQICCIHTASDFPESVRAFTHNP